MHRANEIERTVPWRQRLSITRKEVETVMATYTAAFVATLAFIA
ncbi:hypothetical protein [Aurantiacibacter aquimixticola]|nr:hypothetical protein [Aurantiacibacter aquimixticola]